MKKHKKLIIRLAILVIVLAAIILWVSNPFKKSNLKKWQSQVSEADYQEAIAYLRASEFASSKVPYLTFIEDKVVDYSLESKEAELVNTPSNTCPKNYNGVYFDASENYEVEYTLNVATAGLYELELDYYVGEKVYNNLALQVYINDEIEFDEAKAIDVPLIWKDRTKEFSKDTYGDESLPIQDRILDWFTLSLFNNTYVSDTPLMFYLKEGENKIKIVNAQRGELYLGKLVAKAPTKYLSYSEYLEANNGQDISMKALMINAIDYTFKNSSYVRLTAYQNPSVTPFGAVYKKINCIDGTAWNKNGQSITYEFDVAESGYYNIGFHYLNSKDQFSVFRTILIDGEVPFEEMLSYEIKAKSQSKWSYETLNDGKNNYKFYLEAGHHMLTIRAENSKVSQALRDIQFLIDHINQFSLQVKRLIGGDTADKNKSWNFLDLMPESEELLKSYQLVIKYMVINLAKYSEDKDLSATISYLNTAINKLNQPIKKVDYLPLYLGLLYSGSGSVTQMLGDSLTRISTTPLYLDYINISGSNTKVKVKANANFFSRTWASTKTFFASFFSKKYKIKKDKTAITVWINRPLTYVDIIQKMVDSEFTTKTGIKVQISIMPDSNKLILANSAKQTPDIALGLASYIPYDLAIRGALADFTMFDDFYQVVSGKTSDDISIPAGVFVSQMLDDKIYGIPETLDFNALAYRKDVYDLYYLIAEGKINSKKVTNILNLFFASSKRKPNDIYELQTSIEDTLNNNDFALEASKPASKWIDVDYKNAVETIIGFTRKL